MKTELKRPYPPELIALAEKLIWYEKPDEALAKTDKFLCAVMDRGRTEAIVLAKKYYSEADFRAALGSAFSQNMSPRSRKYWTVMLE